MHTDFNKYVNYFVNEKKMARDTAEEIAARACSLIGRLKEGVVTFCFVKKDGSVRQAVGTLMESKMDELRFKNSGRHTKDGNIAYFDLDKNEWRSLTCERLLSVK